MASSASAAAPAMTGVWSAHDVTARTTMPDTLTLTAGGAGTVKSFIINPPSPGYATDFAVPNVTAVSVNSVGATFTQLFNPVGYDANTTLVTLNTAATLAAADTITVTVTITGPNQPGDEPNGVAYATTQPIAVATSDVILPAGSVAVTEAAPGDLGLTPVAHVTYSPSPSHGAPVNLQLTGVNGFGPSGACIPGSSITMDSGATNFTHPPLVVVGSGFGPITLAVPYEARGAHDITIPVYDATCTTWLYNAVMNTGQDVDGTAGGLSGTTGVYVVTPIATIDQDGGNGAAGNPITIQGTGFTDPGTITAAQLVGPGSATTAYPIQFGGSCINVTPTCSTLPYTVGISGDAGTIVDLQGETLAMPDGTYKLQLSQVAVPTPADFETFSDTYVIGKIASLNPDSGDGLAAPTKTNQTALTLTGLPTTADHVRANTITVGGLPTTHAQINLSNGNNNPAASIITLPAMTTGSKTVHIDVYDSTDTTIVSSFDLVDGYRVATASFTPGTGIDSDRIGITGSGFRDDTNFTSVEIGKPLGDMGVNNPSAPFNPATDCVTPGANGGDCGLNLLATGSNNSFSNDAGFGDICPNGTINTNAAFLAHGDYDVRIKTGNGGQKYSCATNPAAIDSTNLTDTGVYADDAFTSVSAPFSFDYMGETINAGDPIYLSTNGLVTFDAGNTSFSNSANNLQGMTAIAPLWRDWRTSRSTGYNQTNGIYYKSLTDTLTVKWIVQSFSSVGPVTTFEMVIHRGGQIEFRYGDIDSINARQATIGLGDDTGSGNADKIVSDQVIGSAIGVSFTRLFSTLTDESSTKPATFDFPAKLHINPSIEITPNPNPDGSAGATVTVSGYGFDAGAVIPANSIVIGGSPTTHVSQAVGLDGRFTVQVTITNALAPGRYTVVVPETGPSASFSFPGAYGVSGITITPTATHGANGDVFTISGQGFQPGRSIRGAFPVLADGTNTVDGVGTLISPFALVGPDGSFSGLQVAFGGLPETGVNTPPITVGVNVDGNTYPNLITVTPALAANSYTEGNGVLFHGTGFALSELQGGIDGNAVGASVQVSVVGHPECGFDNEVTGSSNPTIGELEGSLTCTTRLAPGFYSLQVDEGIVGHGVHTFSNVLQVGTILVHPWYDGDKGHAPDVLKIANDELPSHQNFIDFNTNGSVDVLVTIANPTLGPPVSQRMSLLPRTMTALTFPGVLGGPVDVQMSGHGTATMESTWGPDLNHLSFEQTAFVPVQSLSNRNVLPVYDNTEAANWIVVTNPLGAVPPATPATANYTITIDGNVVKTGSIAPGGSAVYRAAGNLIAGPVVVTSDFPVLVSSRTLGFLGGYSYSELLADASGTGNGTTIMGTPTSAHTAAAVFDSNNRTTGLTDGSIVWTDAVGTQNHSFVVFANTGTADVTVHVALTNPVAGQPLGEDHVVKAGETAYALFPGTMGGPLRVIASGPITVSLRELWQNLDGSWSFDEVFAQSGTYRWPTGFNSETSANYTSYNTQQGPMWLVIGNVGTETSGLTIEIGGTFVYCAGDEDWCDQVGRTADRGPVDPNETIFPMFQNRNDGPVTVFFETSQFVSSERSLLNPSGDFTALNGTEGPGFCPPTIAFCND